MTRRSLLAALFAIAAVFTYAVADDDAAPADSKTVQKKALGEFNSLIGGWRGTGQPRRGSNKGAWRETAEWVWDFTDEIRERRSQTQHTHGAGEYLRDRRSG